MVLYMNIVLLEGVREDVVDILLNLKGVAITMLSDRDTADY